jgi:hypothetical protein
LQTRKYRGENSGRRKPVRISPHAIFPYAFKAGIRACKTCVPPSHESSQWLVGTPTLAYRCGGSPGMQETLNKFRAGRVILRQTARRINGSGLPLPGSRLTRSLGAIKAPETWRDSTRISARERLSRDIPATTPEGCRRRHLKTNMTS